MTFPHLSGDVLSIISELIYPCFTYFDIKSANFAKSQISLNFSV